MQKHWHNIILISQAVKWSWGYIIIIATDIYYIIIICRGLQSRRHCFEESISGANRIPPLGFPKSPTLQFSEDNLYPTATTCAPTLTIPTRYGATSNMNDKNNYLYVTGTESPAHWQCRQLSHYPLQKTTQMPTLVNKFCFLILQCTVCKEILTSEKLNEFTFLQIWGIKVDKKLGLTRHLQMCFDKNSLTYFCTQMLLHK